MHHHSSQGRKEGRLDNASLPASAKDEGSNSENLWQRLAKKITAQPIQVA